MTVVRTTSAENADLLKPIIDLDDVLLAPAAPSLLLPAEFAVLVVASSAEAELLLNIMNCLLKFRPLGYIRNAPGIISCVHNDILAIDSESANTESSPLDVGDDEAPAPLLPAMAA